MKIFAIDTSIEIWTAIAMTFEMPGVGGFLGAVGGGDCIRGCRGSDCGVSGC